MNREEIIRLAREAGFADGVVDIVGLAGFAIFAALVRADEREACAMECIKLAHKWTRLGAWGENNEFHDCAAAIRARGEK